MNNEQSSRSSSVARVPVQRSRARLIGRRIAFAVAAFFGLGIVLGLAGCGYEALTSASDAEHYPPPGRMVDVGGFRMHVYCTGEGETTVVLDAGLGGASLDWNLVQPELRGSARVCSYDRAGMGWSEPSPAPRTPEQIARELHALLTKANISPPYVLVGHSLAGKNIRMFASKHPEEVAGMVLIDARSEYVDARTSSADADAFNSSFQMQGTLYEVARQTGLARLLGGDLMGFPSAMSGKTRQTMALLLTSGNAVTASTAEARARASSDDALEAAPSLVDLPLVVLASGQNMKDLEFWPEGQSAQAGLSTSGRLQVVEGGHYIHWEHPAVVVDAIREVVASAELRMVDAR